MSNTKSILREEIEKLKHVMTRKGDTEQFETRANSIKCTIPEYDDVVTTLPYYLELVCDATRPGETNTNIVRTLVRLRGKDIHPVYADWLIVCTAEDLVDLVGCISSEHDTPEKLKEAYARLLKMVGKYAPQTAEILRSKSYEKVESRQEFKYAQYEIVMGLYIVKYLLLGKPFTLATEFCDEDLAYTLHEWYEPTETMSKWDNFVKTRHERRHGVIGKCTPKDNRHTSYLLDDRGSTGYTEEKTHQIMRIVRQERKGKAPSVSKDGNPLILPFDGMDYNCKKWSGVILSHHVVKDVNDPSTEPAPNRDEIFHTTMWEVFGKDTRKLEGKRFSLFLFNNQRRRDLAYEWMKGEPVVYDD